MSIVNQLVSPKDIVNEYNQDIEILDIAIRFFLDNEQISDIFYLDNRKVNISSIGRPELIRILYKEPDRILVDQNLISLCFERNDSRMVTQRRDAIRKK